MERNSRRRLIFVLGGPGGDHTLSIKIATGNVSGGIAKFAVKQRTCPGCKVVLSPNGKRATAPNSTIWLLTFQRRAINLQQLQTKPSRTVRRSGKVAVFPSSYSAFSPFPQIAKVRLHETAFNRVIAPKEKEASIVLNPCFFPQLWAQCQRCQGSLHQDVLCTR